MAVSPWPTMIPPSVSLVAGASGLLVADRTPLRGDGQAVADDHAAQGDGAGRRQRVVVAVRIDHAAAVEVDEVPRLHLLPRIQTEYAGAQDDQRLASRWCGEPHALRRAGADRGHVRVAARGTAQPYRLRVSRAGRQAGAASGAQAGGGVAYEDAHHLPGGHRLVGPRDHVPVGLARLEADGYAAARQYGLVDVHGQRELFGQARVVHEVAGDDLARLVCCHASLLSP